MEAFSFWSNGDTLAHLAAREIRVGGGVPTTRLKDSEKIVGDSRLLEGTGSLYA